MFAKDATVVAELEAAMYVMASGASVKALKSHGVLNVKVQGCVTGAMGPGQYEVKEQRSFYSLNGSYFSFPMYYVMSFVVVIGGRYG